MSIDGGPGEGPNEHQDLETREVDVCKECRKHRIASREGYDGIGRVSESAEYDAHGKRGQGHLRHLMEDVLEDENIKRALERVAGNKGAPGIDGWVAHRVRQYVFKQWRGVHTRFRNLHDLCPMKCRGPEDSVSNIWIVRCWRASRTPVMHLALNGIWLKEHGLYFLKEGWYEVQERCWNRRVGAPTHGGVRGRTVN